MSDEPEVEYSPDLAPERDRRVVRMAPEPPLTREAVKALIDAAVVEALAQAAPAVVDALSERVRTMPELKGPQGPMGPQGQAVIAGGGGGGVRLNDGTPINTLAAGTNVTITASGGTATVAATSTTPTLAAVLLAGADPAGTAIAGTDNRGASGPGGNVRLDGGIGATGQDGGTVHFYGGSGDNNSNNGGYIQINGGVGDGTAGDIEIGGGDPKSGSGKRGGDIRLVPTSGDGAGRHGLVFLNLPTSDPVVAGALWASAGTVKVSAG